MPRAIEPVGCNSTDTVIYRNGAAQQSGRTGPSRLLCICQLLPCFCVEPVWLTGHQLKCLRQVFEAPGVHSDREQDISPAARQPFGTLRAFRPSESGALRRRVRIEDIEADPTTACACVTQTNCIQIAQLQAIECYKPKLRTGQIGRNQIRHVGCCVEQCRVFF